MVESDIEVDASQIIKETRETVKKLSDEIAQMEEKARLFAGLRKMPISKAAEEAEKLNFPHFSNTTGVIYLKLAQLHVSLCVVCLKNPDDNNIIAELESLWQEVNALGDRLRIATHVRDIIHEESKKIIEECERILHPK